MPLFETYIIVDWSARNTLSPKKPTADAVWLGELTPSINAQSETYFRSRRECFHFIVERLRHHFDCKHRILLGFDFSFAYPQGFASALNLPMRNKGAWWDVWTELSQGIDDADDNTNNRFAVAADLNGIVGDGQGGPFWGLPAGQVRKHLRPNSPGFPFKTAKGLNLERLRITETRMRRMQETWKLYGAGSVGSQTLVGIPYLYRLRKHADLDASSAVWPFETGFTPTPVTAAGPYIVHAEIWPGIVRETVASIFEKQPMAIKDQIQVRVLCQWMADRDQQNELGRFFDVPDGIDKKTIQVCIEHEGWILGAA
jgi:hypothetical protein